MGTTKEREEVERTTKQKMARRHNREGGIVCWLTA